MSTEQKKATSENICEFLKNNMVPIDNIPEDTNQRQEICMKARASLLIEAHCTSEHFPAFMKCGVRKSEGWVYSLPITINYKSDGERYTFNKFIIKNNHNYYDEVISPWGLYSDLLCHQYTKDAEQLRLIMESREIRELENQFQQDYRCKFELCSQISPYKTPAQVCRFWGCKGDVFAALKSGNMKVERLPAKILGTTQERKLTAKEIDDVLVEFLPCSIVGSKLSFPSQQYFDNWFCQLFPFRNQFGDIQMQVIKLFDDEEQVKFLLPVTSWTRGNCPHSQFFGVPLPEDKQPLYNLYLLSKPDNTVVVLTDSIEIADLLQQNAPNGVVFTSFIGALGCYDQVDWSPLCNKTVYYLITNHSGISMEAATLKAMEIKNYFDDRDAFEFSLDFIVVPVDYHTSTNSKRTKRQNFNSVDDILRLYREDPPKVCSNDIRVLQGKDEFQKFYQQAEATINARPPDWWQLSKPSQEEERIVEQEQNKPAPINFIIHPILIKGEATMIYAGKSTGKSALAYSLAAIATSCSARTSPLLKEKWWINSHMDCSMHKVLYLDFENGAAEIKQRIKNFVDPYWSSDKDVRKKSCGNLIIKDMLSEKNENVDYSLPDNHQRIIDMINKAKNAGVQGQPVDLLIIDTYTKFVRTENPQTPTNFSDLIDKIRNMGIAVLILHHSNSEGEARGLKSKLDSLYFTLQLYRNDELQSGVCTLEDPFKVKLEYSRMDFPKKFMAEFEVQNTNTKWQVVNPQRSETEELRTLADFYKKKGYDRETIAQILGMSKSTLQEKLKK